MSEKMNKKLGRRAFLRAGAGLAAASALSACAAPARPVQPAETGKQESVPTVSRTLDRYNNYTAPKNPVPPGRIQMYGGMNAQDEAKLRAEFEKFSQINPGVTVEIMNVSGDEKLMALIAAGTPPDIWWTPHGATIQVADGTILDIAPYLKDDPILEDLLPPYRQMYAGLDGGIYGLPGGAWFWLIIYNKKLLDEAGVPYPSSDWTWDDLLEKAQKLTTENRWGYLNPGLVWVGGLMPFLLSNDGREVSEDGTRWLVDTPESLAAIQFMYDLIHTHKVMPSPDTLKGFGVTERQAFAEGRLAMSTDSSQPDWALPIFAEVLGWDGFDVVILPRPTGKSLKNWVSSGGFSASAKTKNPQAAVEVLKFITYGSEIWWPAASYQSGIAAFINLHMERMPELEKTQWKTAYEEGAQKAVFAGTTNPFAAYRYTGREWGAFIDRLWNGRAKPEELKTLVPQWNAQYAAGLEKDLKEVPLKPAYKEALEKLLEEVRQRG